MKNILNNYVRGLLSFAGIYFLLFIVENSLEEIGFFLTLLGSLFCSWMSLNVLITLSNIVRDKMFD